MFFVYFALIITAGLFISVVHPLSLGRIWKLLLTLLILLMAGRLAILREIFGGLGGVECDRRLLLATSFLQNLAIFLFALAILRDLVYVLCLPFHFLAPVKEGALAFRHFLKGAHFTLILVFLSAILSGWSLHEATKIPDVKKSEVVLDKLPPELDGLKVALLADTHISRFYDRDWVNAVVERTNALDPDIILIPGDLVDGETRLRAGDVEPLSRLKSRYGKFFCVGNHEYISRLPDWMPVFQNLGLRNLYNLNVPVNLRGTVLYLAGVTDQAAYSRNLPGPDLRAALKGVPRDAPVILLEHRPSNAKENAQDGRVSLQISGHTHGGLFPILKTITKKANRGYLKGFYEVGSMKLYVHPGTGLWSGMPARILDPSEITLLTLRSPR
ncbi:MAG: metallophosphoesterase [Deltaproteobacteria bacterium]|jgi:predicted MPP superfamily phosphohydrolase|nr:metallophosphoesterase [Deltaproteobacteria bacterium]